MICVWHDTQPILLVIGWTLTVKSISGIGITIQTSLQYNCTRKNKYIKKPVSILNHNLVLKHNSPKHTVM